MHWRCRQILNFIVRGYCYEDIGLELCLSTSTVKMYSRMLREHFCVAHQRDLLRLVYAYADSLALGPKAGDPSPSLVVVAHS